LIDIIEIIKSICLIVSAVLIFIAAIGILRLDDDKDKIIYVRIQILGVMDIAGVLAMIGLNQIFLAGIYFILAPILAHAMANAYYYGEENHSKSFLELIKEEKIMDKDNITSSNNNINNSSLNNKDNDNINNSSLNNNDNSPKKGNSPKGLKIINKKNIGSDDEHYTISTLEIDEDEKDD
jgi:energy-converting hydrogenase B subunit C